MDGGAWRATDRGVAKSRTRLSDRACSYLELLGGLSELVHISIHSSVWYHKMTFLLVLLLMLELLLQIIPPKNQQNSKEKWACQLSQ